MSETVSIGYCGVCCSHCGMQWRIPRMAEELRRFIKAYKYGDWIQHITQDFEFDNLLKGLNWFSGSGCKGCLQDGGMPSCEVRACCKVRKLKNCYFCEDFLKCGKLAYQKDTYRIDVNYNKIGDAGYEGWLKEQKRKTREGFDNVFFLEQKG